MQVLKNLRKSKNYRNHLEIHELVVYVNRIKRQINKLVKTQIMKDFVFDDIIESLVKSVDLINELFDSLKKKLKEI